MTEPKDGDRVRVTFEGSLVGTTGYFRQKDGQFSLPSFMLDFGKVEVLPDEPGVHDDISLVRDVTGDIWERIDNTTWVRHSGVGTAWQTEQLIRDKGPLVPLTSPND